eukprot:3274017-Rhodomonas_salina.1
MHLNALSAMHKARPPGSRYLEQFAVGLSRHSSFASELSRIAYSLSASWYQNSPSVGTGLRVAGA